MKKEIIYILSVALIVLRASSVFAQGDSPCTATLMTVNNGVCGAYTAGTTVGATYSNNAANGGTPTCSTVGAPDVWYQFVAPASGQIRIATTAGTITDGAMQIYGSSNNLCSGTFTAYNCDDDSGPGLMPELNLCGLTAGNTYFLRFWAYGGSATGTFNICFYVNATSNVAQDCQGGSQVCSNASIPGNASGSGGTELNACNIGCLSAEHNSSWYYINVGTSGTVTMTITPSNGTDDYDFAIWGPTNSCPPPSAPIRCNFAAYPRAAGCGTNTNPTGLDNVSAFTSASACQNRPFLQQLTVVAGEVYILLVDNFTAAASPFTLSWGGTSTLSCTPVTLPIELTSFEAHLNGSKVQLKWVTASETNNDYFTLEKSKDGSSFSEIAQIKGAGNSSSMINYMETDYNPYNGISYYRLKQTDYNGVATYSNTVPVEYHPTGDFSMSIFPNPGELKDIKLQLSAAKGQEILVVVRDLTGRELYSKIVIIETANGQIEAIDNNHTIAPGVYLVTASSNNAIYSQRLIIKE